MERHSVALLTIVLASSDVEAIVDRVLIIDHAASLERRPLLLGPRQIISCSIAATVRKVCSNIQKELVRGCIDVGMAFVPPDQPTAWRRTSGRLHVFEDGLRRGEVLPVTGNVVSRDPR